MTDRPIARLPIPPQAEQHPILAEMFGRIRAAGRRVLNIHRVVGLSPQLLRAQATYAAAMREESSLPRALQELLILRVAQINNSEYEQSVHRGVARGLGVTAEQIGALPAWRNATVFDARQRAALGFVEQAAATGEVDDAVFAAAQAVFAAREIVEIAALVAWYVGNARLVRALRIELEAEQA